MFDTSLVPARFRKGLCHFCLRPVTLADGFLELYSVSEDRLGYPGDGRPVAIYTHADCGPDCGYPIALKRCTDVHAKWGWLDHLCEKRWRSVVYSDALIAAEALVMKLNRKKAK